MDGVPTDLYLRVSTKKQKEEGLSLQGQERAGRALAAEEGLDIVRVYYEDFPGDTLDRPDFDTLRKRVRAGETRAVIIYDPDRLARDPILQAIAELEFEKHKVQIYYVTEPPDSSPEGNLVRYIKGYAAQIERLQIRERTMRGKKERALKGKLPTGGGGLYGYVYNKQTGKREVNEDEAAIVRMAYQWVAEEDLGVSRVAIRLREMGIPTPNGNTVWSTATVQRMIRNEAYKGVVYANKWKSVEPKRRFSEHPKIKNSHQVLRDPDEWILLADNTPAIVSDEFWDTANKAIDRHAELNPRCTKHEYLLRGHVWCAECNQRMYGTPLHGRLGYRCNYKKTTHTDKLCQNRTPAAAPLEAEVWGKIREAMLTRETIIAQVEERLNETPDTTAETLAVIDERIKKVKAKESKLVRLFTAEDLDEELMAEQLKLLKREREGFQAERERLTQLHTQHQSLVDLRASIDEYCERVALNIDSLTFEDKRDLLEGMQVKVWVTKEGGWVDGIIPLGELRSATSRSIPGAGDRSNARSPTS